MPGDRLLRLMDIEEFRQTALPLHDEMLSLWEELRGSPENAPPARKDFSLTKVGGKAKYISVTELTPEGRLRLRLSSTLFDETTGVAASGQYFDDIMSPRDAAQLQPLISAAITTPCGLYTDQTVVLASGATFLAKSLYLPCYNEGQPSSVIGTVHADEQGMKYLRGGQQFVISERQLNEAFFIDLGYGLPSL
ncbi:hypothetical protein [Emcibacter nanhaiensis]|uniref:PAS domain-containing protein n=1 Tax=Emcibacter nanhaiensis TaxID=1505037 RepID=A0A501PRJ5_9PROT|nr:hypothetical protein [Emcibacter nanhaiensis]TPD63150.1 hypothetical protein FIV46_03480 [Emcibacter nanhaiensis]